LTLANFVNQTPHGPFSYSIKHNLMSYLTQNHAPDGCITLLSRLHRPKPMSAQKLTFSGIGQRDVYNIAAPFKVDGRQVIAGRVESREVEHSEIVFFAAANGTFQPIPSAATFPGLQDPCIAFIGSEIILGGVRFPVTVTDGSVGWRMEFYRGSSVDNLKLFLVGPDKMKDIRLVELMDEQIGVLTRPQGAKGGLGKIGFLTAPTLEAITAVAIQDAPLFEGQCRDDEWLGANEAHRLQNGMIGVLGHIAYFDAQKHRHYYAMVFCVDPSTGRATSPEIIASRSDFSDGPAKRPDLVDVMFSGGLVRHGDGTATLYAGLSDAEAGCALLPDPFSKFEKPVNTHHTPTLSK
jgi:hypothetical protein